MDLIFCLRDFENPIFRKKCNKKSVFKSRYLSLVVLWSFKILLRRQKKCYEQKLLFLYIFDSCKSNSKNFSDTGFPHYSQGFRSWEITILEYQNQHLRLKIMRFPLLFAVFPWIVKTPNTKSANNEGRLYKKSNFNYDFHFSDASKRDGRSVTTIGPMRHSRSTTEIFRYSFYALFLGEKC